MILLLLKLKRAYRYLVILSLLCVLHTQCACATNIKIGPVNVPPGVDSAQLLAIIDTGVDSDRFTAFLVYSKIVPDDTAIYFRALEDSNYLVRLGVLFAAQSAIKDTLFFGELSDRIENQLPFDTHAYSEAVRTLDDKIPQALPSIFPNYMFEALFLEFSGRKYNNLIIRDLESTNIRHETKILLAALLVATNDTEVIPMFIAILKNPRIDNQAKISLANEIHDRGLKLDEISKEEITNLLPDIWFEPLKQKLTVLVGN